MTPLTFDNYGFASLPSGTYLFFPKPKTGAKAKVPVVGAAAKPERVVLVTNPERLPDAPFSGIADGGTLYVTLEPAAFNEVLESLSKAQPIEFQFKLDSEETLTQLQINGKSPDANRARRTSDAAPVSHAG